MVKLRFSFEDYPAISGFIIASFERDLSDFTPHYKTMDSDYLMAFKRANEAVKSAQSKVVGAAALKATTLELYALADNVAFEVRLLRDYALRGGVDGSIIGRARLALTRRNIEKGIKVLRDALPYYTQHAASMKDMPGDFLMKMAANVEKMERLNTEQNKRMNERKENSRQNHALYVNLDKFITEVCTSGKLIYKGMPKQEEYVFSKLLSRVRAGKPKPKFKDEEPQESSSEQVS